MRRVCPECQAAFDTQFLCPNCGVQLLDEPESAVAKAGAAHGAEELVRSPEMATRFLAGVVLAQGLYYGLRLMGTAGQQALGSAIGWAPPVGRLPTRASCWCRAWRAA